MASGGTLTSSTDVGGSFHYAYLAIPTMTSNSQIHIQVSDEKTGTYRRILFPSTTEASPPKNNAFGVSSSATNSIVPIPNGFKFYKIETTATIDNGATFKIFCSE